MLDQLLAAPCRAALAQTCVLAQGEWRIEAVLDEVAEKPLARHPGRDADTRTPFSLLFRAPAGCPHGDGLYSLEIPGLPEIPAVFLTRVVNIGPQPGALFQAVFN